MSEICERCRMEPNSPTHDELDALDEGKAWSVSVWHGDYYVKKNGDTGKEAYEWIHEQSETHKLGAFAGEYFVKGLLHGNAGIEVVDMSDTPFE